jgi:LicD family
MPHAWFISLIFGFFWRMVLSHPQPFTIEQSASTPTEIQPAPTLNEIDRNKYFHEPGGHEPGENERLGHYDTRYFHGLVSLDERTETLTHMVRAYLTTFQSLGLETWIAHGTLLGWWWNGKVEKTRFFRIATLKLTQTKILPWDWDIDTQVSGATLGYMAEHHNKTTHKYISEDKEFERTYLLDVNPWSRQRDFGDGANIIDARWIDMTNGLYIDITGLSEVYPKEKPGIWSCKNFHDYRVQDLYPLRNSIFEGVPARIPYAYDELLVEEYRPQALVDSTHEGYDSSPSCSSPSANPYHRHLWHEDVQKWIPISAARK